MRMATMAEGHATSLSTTTTTTTKTNDRKDIIIGNDA